MHSLQLSNPAAEDGMAVLIAVILLLLISALAITTLQHSSQEAQGAGRARHQLRHLHAADGLLEVVAQQLIADEPFINQEAIDYDQFIQDPYSQVWTSVRTGTLDAPAGEDIQQNGGGQPRDGYSLDGPIRFFSYTVNVTASDENSATGGRLGLQAQYSVLDKSGGSGPGGQY